MICEWDKCMQPHQDEMSAQVEPTSGRSEDFLHGVVCAWRARRQHESWRRLHVVQGRGSACEGHDDLTIIIPEPYDELPDCHGDMPQFHFPFPLTQPLCQSPP